tara:strand:+ start:1872 stop:2039 length:168 start_codon:yes stop_codon:yes gene_type:complete
MDNKKRIPNGMTAIQMALMSKQEKKEAKKVSMIAQGVMKGEMMSDMIEMSMKKKK